MPLTLNVGLSKKIGQANYGSVGASCNVEIELDPMLLRDDLDGFHAQVRNAYAACRQAVQDELSRHEAGEVPTEPVNETNTSAAPTARPSATNGRHGNGSSHTASSKQLDYITQLARQIRGLGIRRVESLAQKMFGKPLAGLTSLDASGLIDTLKAVKAGDVDINDLLEDVAR